jgi:hypothetical protein
MTGIKNHMWVKLDTEREREREREREKEGRKEGRKTFVSTGMWKTLAVMCEINDLIINSQIEL